jgi:hypothetical protein
MIDASPANRCSAMECLVAFKEEFPHIVDNPLDGTLERLLSDAIKQPLRVNGSAQQAYN